MPVIKLEDVSFLYSRGTVFETAAIQNINIEIARGEFVGVIGHTALGNRH